MQIDTNDTIILHQNLYLGGNGWRDPKPWEENEIGFLPKGELQFKYMYWLEPVECEGKVFEDNDPAYGFTMLDNPDDRNYPEFSLADLKRFFRLGYMELKKEE